jgi:ABC-type sulfate transport system permease component
VVRPIPRNAPSIGAYGSILVIAGGTHTSSRCGGAIYEK